jgi:hypothetical protein
MLIWKNCSITEVSRRREEKVSNIDLIDDYW